MNPTSAAGIGKPNRYALISCGMNLFSTRTPIFLPESGSFFSGFFHFSPSYEPSSFAQLAVNQ